MDGECERLTASVAPQVPKDKSAGAAAAATAENLNNALASSGISVGAVSSPKISDAAPDTGAANEARSGGLGVAGLAGIVAGVVVLLVVAGAGLYWWGRSRSARQFVRIPTRPVP